MWLLIGRKRQINQFRTSGWEMGSHMAPVNQCWMNGIIIIITIPYVCNNIPGQKFPLPDQVLLVRFYS